MTQQATGGKAGGGLSGGMSGADLRPLMGHVIIALAICVGGYMVLVEPQRRSLVEVQNQIATVQAEIAGATTLTGKVSSLTSRLKELMGEAKAISQAGAIARDETELYEMITTLASDNKITVQQMTPIKQEQRGAARGAAAPQRPPVVGGGPAVGPAAGPSPMEPAGAGAPGAAPAVSGPSDTMIGYGLTFVADYADVTRFLSDLSNKAGLSQVKTVKLSPTNGESGSAVQGEISVEFYAFDVAMPEAPAAAEPGRLPLSNFPMPVVGGGEGVKP